MLHKDYDRKGSFEKRFLVELWLSQLRAAVLRIEKLVAEVKESSSTQRKGNVRHWKPLPSNG
jgi:hypothetical protein